MNVIIWEQRWCGETRQGRSGSHLGEVEELKEFAVNRQVQGQRGATYRLLFSSRPLRRLQCKKRACGPLCTHVPLHPYTKLFVAELTMKDWGQLNVYQ